MFDYRRSTGTWRSFSRATAIVAAVAVLSLGVHWSAAADQATGDEPSAATTQPATTKPVGGRTRAPRPPMKSAPVPKRPPKPGEFKDAAAAAAHVADVDPDLQTKAVTWLADHRVDPAQRELVIAGIRDRLNTLSDTRRRLIYVRAYARYADASDVPDLLAVIDYPEEVEGISGQEPCWAAALAGIVRIGDADAARTALDKRKGSIFFDGNAKSALLPFVQVDAPQAELASELIDRLEGR